MEHSAKKSKPALWEGPELAPATRRLLQQVGRQVLAGQLTPGTTLPSLRRLAAERGLSVFPIQQALKCIEQQGWARRSGRGGRLVVSEHAAERARAYMEQTPPPVINFISTHHGQIHIEFILTLFAAGFTSVFPRCSIRRVHLETAEGIDTITQLLHENAGSSCEVGYLLSGVPGAIREMFRFQDVACVVAGYVDPATNLPCVYEDMNEIGYVAGRLLCRTSPVVTLYEQELVGAEYNLIDGFRRAARRFGDPSLSWEKFYRGLSSDGPESERQIEELLSSAERPGGIFTLRPQHAMRVMKVARRLGIRIPEQLQLIGYQHSPMYALVDPEITSIGPKSYQELGRCCAELLAESLGSRPRIAPRDQIESTLIERASTLPFRQGSP